MADFDLPAPLTAQELQDVNTHLDALETLLSRFDISLTPEQIRQMQKMGQKSVPFAQECLAAAQNNGSALPPDFDVAAFAVALALYNQMATIGLKLKQMTDGVENTATVAGSQTMGDANSVYGYFKTGARKKAALKAIVALLAERYKQSRAKTPPPNNPA